MADGSGGAANPYRQYEGFSYPTAAARPAGATGIAMRAAATGNATGYSYFHQRGPSSATGGGSGVGGTGSVHGNMALAAGARAPNGNGGTTVNNNNLSAGIHVSTGDGSDVGSAYSSPAAAFATGQVRARRPGGAGSHAGMRGSGSSSNVALRVETGSSVGAGGGGGTTGGGAYVTPGFAGGGMNAGPQNNNIGGFGQNLGGAQQYGGQGGQGAGAGGYPAPEVYSGPNQGSGGANWGYAGAGAADPSGGFSGADAATAAPARQKRGLFGKFLSNLLSDPADGAAAAGGPGAAAAPRPLYQTRFGHPEDDLPLLQELGVSPGHIIQKTRAVLNPLRPVPPDVMKDNDLAGPVVFAALLAFLLTLRGKIQFSGIYGLCVTGVLVLKVLLALLRQGLSVTQQQQQQQQPPPPGSPASTLPGAPVPPSFGDAGSGGFGSGGSGGGGGGPESAAAPYTSAPLVFVMSGLGYALLPNVVLALVRTLQYWLLHTSAGVLPLAAVAVGWSSWCATSLLVRGLGMQAQRFLILYPMLLFYSAFAALTIF